jgi:hypothetical protein
MSVSDLKPFGSGEVAVGQASLLCLNETRSFGPPFQDRGLRTLRTFNRLVRFADVFKLEQWQRGLFNWCGVQSPRRSDV